VQGKKDATPVRAAAGGETFGNCGLPRSRRPRQPRVRQAKRLRNHQRLPKKLLPRCAQCGLRRCEWR
jgi:hypothetical protein